MSLAATLASALDAGGSTLTLTKTGADVAAPVSVDGWSVEQGVAVCRVTFGPFAQRVAADGVRLRVGDDSEIVPFEDSVVMSRGMTLDYELGVTVGLS